MGTANRDPSCDHDVCLGISDLRLKLDLDVHETASCIMVNLYFLAAQWEGSPSSHPFLFLTLRIRHAFTFPSSPVVTTCTSSTPGRNDKEVTFANPCGRSILVFNIQNAVFLSQYQSLRYTSPRNESSPSRLSIVAIHSPLEEMAARSTRAGSRALSSRLETRFEGETSSSATRVKVEGEYVWREDGWEEGRIRVSEGWWKASGVEDEDGQEFDTKGSVVL